MTNLLHDNKVFWAELIKPAYLYTSRKVTVCC